MRLEHFLEHPALDFTVLFGSILPIHWEITLCCRQVLSTTAVEYVSEFHDHVMSNSAAAADSDWQHHTNVVDHCLSPDRSKIQQKGDRPPRGDGSIVKRTHSPATWKWSFVPGIAKPQP